MLGKMGSRASEVARQWFAENRYRDYLYLHGLSVEMTEALAEYVHKRIRSEMGLIMPAKAGIHFPEAFGLLDGRQLPCAPSSASGKWTPAFAGVTATG